MDALVVASKEITLNTLIKENNPYEPLCSDVPGMFQGLVKSDIQNLCLKNPVYALEELGQALGTCVLSLLRQFLVCL